MENGNTVERFKSLMDREAIREVLSKWCMAIDRLDRARILECFHPDAVIQQLTHRDPNGVPIVQHLGSPASIAASALSKLPEFFELTHYSVGSVRIEVRGTKAFSEAYFYGPKVFRALGADPRQLRLAGGRYLDKFEARSGDWRIVHRTIITDWAVHVPLPEKDTTAFRVMPTAESAILRRDRSDPSFEFWAGL